MHSVANACVWGCVRKFGTTHQPLTARALVALSNSPDREFVETSITSSHAASHIQSLFEDWTCASVRGCSRDALFLFVLALAARSSNRSGLLPVVRDHLASMVASNAEIDTRRTRRDKPRRGSRSVEITAQSTRVRPIPTVAARAKFLRTSYTQRRHFEWDTFGTKRATDDGYGGHVALCGICPLTTSSIARASDRENRSRVAPSRRACLPARSVPCRECVFAHPEDPADKDARLLPGRSCRSCPTR